MEFLQWTPRRDRKAHSVEISPSHSCTFMTIWSFSGVTCKKKKIFTYRMRKKSLWRHWDGSPKIIADLCIRNKTPKETCNLSECCKVKEIIGQVSKVRYKLHPDWITHEIGVARLRLRFFFFYAVTPKDAKCLSTYWEIMQQPSTSFANIVLPH